MEERDRHQDDFLSILAVGHPDADLQRIGHQVAVQSTAPLEIPVVPPLYWNKATSSGPTSTFGRSSGLLRVDQILHPDIPFSQLDPETAFLFFGQCKKESQDRRQGFFKFVTTTVRIFVFGCTCLIRL